MLYSRPITGENLITVIRTDNTLRSIDNYSHKEVWNITSSDITVIERGARSEILLSEIKNYDSDDKRLILSDELKELTNSNNDNFNSIVTIHKYRKYSKMPIKIYDQHTAENSDYSFKNYINSALTRKGYDESDTSTCITCKDNKGNNIDVYKIFEEYLKWSKKGIDTNSIIFPNSSYFSSSAFFNVVLILFLLAGCIILSMIVLVNWRRSQKLQNNIMNFQNSKKNLTIVRPKKSNNDMLFKTPTKHNSQQIIPYDKLVIINTQKTKHQTKGKPSSSKKIESTSTTNKKELQPIREFTIDHKDFVKKNEDNIYCLNEKNYNIDTIKNNDYINLNNLNNINNIEFTSRAHSVENMEKLSKGSINEIETSKLIKELKDIAKIDNTSNNVSFLCKDDSNININMRNKNIVKNIKNSFSTKDICSLKNLIPAEFKYKPACERYFDNGRLLKNFQNFSRIGEGGFGSVFVADHTFDSNRYAIKVVKLKIKEDEDLTNHFVVKEVKTMLRLNHRNVVRYYTCWFEKDNPLGIEDNEEEEEEEEEDDEDDDTNCENVNDKNDIINDSNMNSYGKARNKKINKKLHNIYDNEGSDVDDHEEDLKSRISTSSVENIANKKHDNNNNLKDINKEPIISQFIVSPMKNKDNKKVIESKDKGINLWDVTIDSNKDIEDSSLSKSNNSKNSKNKDVVIVSKHSLIHLNNLSNDKDKSQSIIFERESDSKLKSQSIIFDKENDLKSYMHNKFNSNNYSKNNHNHKQSLQLISTKKQAKIGFNRFSKESSLEFISSIIRCNNSDKEIKYNNDDDNYDYDNDDYLKHNTLINVYFYMQMDYCEGMSLKEFMENRKKLTDKKIIFNFLFQIVNGVEHIHENKIIHRDLK